LSPLYAAVASAQSENEAESFDNLFEELVVTARKREESLTEVPLSIEVFSNDRLVEAGITGLEALATFTPNLDFQNVGNTQPGRWNSGIRFRGMEVDITTPTNQTGGFFVDGVPILGGASSVSFSDIGSVQVIRGPQPVYFGRGTFGGAINYTTITPGTEFAGSISTEYSPTFGSHNVNAWVEGGSELISARLTGFQTVQGSAFDSTDGGELGEEQTTGASIIVFTNPIDELTVKARLAYSENDDKAPSATMIPFTQISADGGRAFEGTVPYSENLITRNTDFYTDPTFGNSLDFLNQVSNGGAPDLSEYGLKSELMTFSLAVEYELSSELKLSAMYGKSENESGNLRDSDQYSAEGWVTKSYLLHDTDSIEARINYDTDRVRAVFGVSQVEIDQDGDVDGGYNFFPNFAFFPIVGYGISRREVVNIKTTGVFAGIEVDLLDNLTVAVDARYQDEENSSQQVRHIGEEGASGNPTDINSESILPRLSLTYKPLNGTTVFASYSEGELPGTVQSNEGLPEEFPDRLDEQLLEVYELGVKQFFLDDAIFLSATLFSQDWSNMIANATFLDADNNPVQGLFPGSSSQDGIELSLNFRLNDNFSGTASYGYTESEYDDYVKDGVDFEGRRLARSPKTSGALGLVWEDQLIDDWSYKVRGDYIYRGNSFADEANLVVIDGYEKLNLHFTLENDSYSFGLFCKNCSDEEAWGTGVQATDFVSFSQAVIVSPILPREIGFRAGLKF
jgi:iron complex outermembrane receptor protein